MKKKVFKEDFQQLDEFIQSVTDIITPISFRDELRAVMDKETRHRMCERYPKCFLPVRMGNRDVPFLPICNRNGATNKHMIAFSMKLANRLLDRKDVDRGMLEITLKKLGRLNTSYSKEIPTPPDVAARKANVTKALNMLKKELDKINSSNDADHEVVEKLPIAPI